VHPHHGLALRTVIALLGAGLMTAVALPTGRLAPAAAAGGRAVTDAPTPTVPHAPLPSSSLVGVPTTTTGGTPSGATQPAAATTTTPGPPPVGPAAPSSGPAALARSTSCPIGSQLVPSCGVLTGLYSNAPGGVPARQTQVGHAFNLVHLYKVTFTDAFPTSTDLGQLGQDTALFIDWDTYTNGGTAPIRWSQIAAGAWNSTIDAEAARLRSYGRPIMVALMHEMELVNKNGAFGTSADFVAAWRTVVSRMRADGATNVVWVWDMGGESAANAVSYYPGNDVVDWIAWDPYNWGMCPRNPSGWHSFTQITSSNYSYFSTTAPYDARPLMLAEFGSVEQTGNVAGKQNWFTAVPSQAAAEPQIKALVYFDSTGACDWAPDSSAPSFRGFTAMTAAGF
jgi:hypothetical protein